MKKDERKIENFELKADYYLCSWLNGNKTHVVCELKELQKLNSNVCLKVISDLYNMDAEIADIITTRLYSMP